MTNLDLTRFVLGERVNVTEPVLWSQGDRTMGFVPGEDLYVVAMPESEGEPEYRVRSSVTGVEGALSDVVLVAMPKHGETLQHALQVFQLTQTTLVATVARLQEMIERRDTDQATKDAVREHGPDFINVTFADVNAPGLVFVDIRDDQGNEVHVGEWSGDDHRRSLRLSYGGQADPKSESERPKCEPDVDPENDNSRSGLANRLRAKEAMILRITELVRTEDMPNRDKVIRIRNIINQG